MRPLLTILALAGVLVMLAAIAVALIFSIEAGRPSWILAGVLAADSLALFLFGAAMLWRHYHRNGAFPS